MKLRQLEYLLAVVDNDFNVTAAAERLFTSQPGVSKQVRLLEDELGLQLFKRHGKSIEGLTAEGRQITDHVRVIFREVQNIDQLAANLRGEKTGTLSIATTHTQARYVLPPVIKQFREAYPDVKLDLHQGTSEQIAEMANSGQIDLAIASGGGEMFSDLVLLPCYKWDRAVIVPEGHPLTEQEASLTLEQLAQYPLVSYVFSLDGNSSLARAFADKDLEPEVVFTARDADVIKTYVKLGMGVGIVASMAQDCEDGSGLVSLTGDHQLFPRTTTWVGLRRDRLIADYALDFVRWFAPHLDREKVGQAMQTQSQKEVDLIFRTVMLPMRGRCAEILL